MKLKKWLLGLVTFAAMVVLCVVCAGAETCGDFEYDVLDDGTVEISGYNGSAEKVDIPEKIDGKSVTSIGDCAFKDCISLTSVTIPDGVKCIGHSAFYECTSLKSITIPDSVTEITGSDGSVRTDGAFGMCTSLESVKLSENLERIDSRTFNGCSALKNITIPGSVKSIGAYAFNGTAIINNQTGVFKYVDKWLIYAFGDFNENGDGTYIDVFIPSDTNGIAENALGIANYYINSLTIPGNISSVGNIIEKYTYDDFNQSYYINNLIFENGVTNIESHAFNRNSQIKNIVLPKSLESIGSYAFNDCKSLQNIEINGCTIIGQSAFSGCTELKEIILPNCTKVIENNAFSRCSSLKSVTLSNGVTSIGDLAFANCTSLVSITIPNSVTSIGYHAFLDCTSLKSITIPASVTYIGDRAIGYYEDKINWIYNRIAGFEIKYTKKTYGHWYATKNGFSDESCSITNELADGTLAIKYAGRDKIYVIPAEIDGKRVTKIDYAAFSYCDNLESITIPDSVTSIDDSAFSGCSNLTRITIPDSVTEIGSYAFEYCSSLTSIIIPDSVTSISQQAFYNCKSLTSITIPNSVTSIDYKAFTYCTSLKSITIPDSVTYIGDSAFYGCRSLTSIMIPDSVRTIGGCAFQDCTSLKSIKIPNSVTSISSCAFYGCTSLTSITIPDSVTSIENDAFTNCTSLTSITIPNSVTYISGGDFSGCASLTAINVTTGNQSYASVNGVLYSKDKTKLIYYPKGKKDKNYKIPDGVMSIDSKAFANNTTLTSVTIPDSVTSIDSYTFSGCTNLTSITIPDSVTEIGWRAFIGCISLKNVTIPKSVTDIDGNAFGYYYDNGYKKIDNFKIYCYSGTEGEKYAIDNGFAYELLNKPILSKVTGVRLGGRAADALRINWTKNASADGYIVEMYQNGKWARVAKITSNSTTTFRKSGLKAGTVYKFRVKAYKMSGSTALYGDYSATVTAMTNPSVMTGAKLGGRAADALRINWSKNASADGYIVEMYQGNKWVRVAKITSNSTTTFKKSGLKASSVYKFRVRAYKMSGSTALYGNYSATVTAMTNPSVMAGAKLGGRAADALRINWSKNASADGYIVEMYQGNKWVRVAKITNSNTTTFRKAGLKASSVYKFRVSAYKMSGKTALYGNYSATVTARTNPSIVKGVKIGGKAKDALRVNWTKNASAQGYIVEMYKGGKWVRVAKITNGNTTTYRKAGLAKNTTYKFRVCAYYMSGKTALYGNYGSVSGKTAAK